MVPPLGFSGLQLFCGGLVILEWFHHTSYFILIYTNMNVMILIVQYELIYRSGRGASKKKASKKKKSKRGGHSSRRMARLRRMSAASA